MSEKTENVSGMNRYRELKAKAKELGITGHMNTEQLEAAIVQAKTGGMTPDPLETPVKEHDGLTFEEAKKIEDRLKYEFEIQEKFRAERQRTTDRASIVAESESLNIPINLPDNPTELELAKARRSLNMEKKEVRPSPETVAIEASKRGYYIFTNREQDDAAHTVNLGGKYFIHLIPDQIHVLSEYHIKKWRQIAVVPQYERVETGVAPGPGTVGQMGQECRRVGGKPRFAFEYLGEAPQEAPFGMVTDMKVLDKIRPKQEEFV
ncbi:hypothetical protein LCGC14_1331110 [marine sediment metagenome]|uniref:Uncharacterized protein n=1 Tax=marine sediment metagenome TaxID=412755 RepID=A0A0F9KHA9_9ZZZZ